MITFLQDVLTLQDGDELPENISTTGLYFIMQDIKDSILNANVMLNEGVIKYSDNVVPIKT